MALFDNRGTPNFGELFARRSTTRSPNWCVSLSMRQQDATTRERWIERLWEAYQADEMPYMEPLGDYWGQLCASKELAAAWANGLLSSARLALSA
jgi:hypothetical protein